MVEKKKMSYPIYVDVSVDDPSLVDEDCLLPKDHYLRTRDARLDFKASIEVKVMNGSPLAAILPDDVNVTWVDLEDMEDMEDNKELVRFIWDELAKGHTVEVKLVWPSDDELKKEVERARKNRRWDLERALTVNSDHVFKKRKKRKR